MKKYAVVILLPLLLWGLETVNLIKDHGFEKNSDVWKVYARTRTGQDLDSFAVSKHSSDRVRSGIFSSYCDTRKALGDLIVDSAVINQGLSGGKKVEDIDSLVLSYSIDPKDDYFMLLHTAFICLFVDANEPSHWFAGYTLKAPDLNPQSIWPRKQIEAMDFPADTGWYSLSKDIKTDFETNGISKNSSVDSFILLGWGADFPPWRGQKVYWDDIRLMGYADYDVGVKEILSGDSLEVGTPYQPEARIKNFGRELADTFLAMAEIWDNTNLIYVDTIPYSLPSDTSEIITFADFIPSATGPYTLTIRTHMEPDESDADDELSKPIGKESITEEPTVENLFLDVSSICSNGVLRVSYSLPSGNSGTLTLYDVTGRRVERLTVTCSGSVEFTRHFPSGVYLVQLKSNGQRVTRKAVVIE